MSLSKETLENNHLDNPTGINILDNLQYESALSEFQNCYKEFLSINEDCKVVIEKHDLINSNLQNESALNDILNNLGYLSTESGETKERVESAIREIKFILKNILTKFIELFTKLKNFIVGFFKRSTDLADTLHKKIKNLGESKKVYSLDHEEFNNHLPIVIDFGNNTQINNMLKDLIECGAKLKSNNYAILVLKHTTANIKPGQNLLIECSKGKISYLTCNENNKLKIAIENTKFKQKELKSRLLSKANLEDLLNKIISFNKIVDGYINDFDLDSKKILDKINKLSADDNESDVNLVNNIRVSLEANGKFSNNIIHVTNGVFFVIANNIKCYENN